MVTNAAVEMDGRIENGRIVLDDPPAWPEGTRLHLRVMKESDAKAEKERLKRLLAFAGSISDLERPEQGEIMLEQERLERLLALAGSVPDLERPPQGEYEVREPLE